MPELETILQKAIAEMASRRDANARAFIAALIPTNCSGSLNIVVEAYAPGRRSRSILENGGR